MGTTFRSRVRQVIRQTFLYTSLVKGEICWQIVDKTWSLVGTRLYKLVLSGIAPVNVLNLRIAKCGFYVVLELLTRSCIWTQNIAAAGDRQTLATRHASIARSSPKSRPIMCTDLIAVPARISFDHTLIVLLAIVVCYNSIRALLL